MPVYAWAAPSRRMSCCTQRAATPTPRSRAYMMTARVSRYRIPMNWTATVWALALNMRVALFWAAWNTAIQAMANTTVLMWNVIRLPQSWVIASKHRSTATNAVRKRVGWGTRVSVGDAPGGGGI